MHRLALTLLVAFCSTAPAAAQPALEIRLFVRSAASDQALDQAQSRTEAILAQTGIDARFQLCDMRRAVPDRCNEPFAPGEIAVQLMARGQRQDGALGYALPRADGSTGRYIRIFDNGVSALAADRRLAHGDLLGHVIAHEIGHLVMGVGRHSKRGLMRADWSLTDLARIGRQGLWFDARQARRLRNALAETQAD